MTTNPLPARADSPLFLPIRLGPYILRNRVVMAPMTRARAEPGDVPGELTVEYYRQRASAGLIISEGAQVSAQGKGYIGTPGIHSRKQVAGWRRVTDAVHAANGRIFLQLWHVGRISHRSLQPFGSLPVAPSDMLPKGQTYVEGGFVPLERPRALDTLEVEGVIEQFASAAERALDAGFDGVEIHAANGYLLDQFLRDGTNRRTDKYGGLIQNRARLLMEITGRVASIWGAHRVGVRLSPVNEFNDISDSDPEAAFTRVAELLSPLRLAYLHVIEGNFGAPGAAAPAFDVSRLRHAFDGNFILNNRYDFGLADKVLRKSQADMIAFGKPFIANPDLVARMKAGIPLAEPDVSTMYSGGAEGYVNYPMASAGV
jgi:N-ethylmaleimide reductase